MSSPVVFMVYEPSTVFSHQFIFDTFNNSSTSLSPKRSVPFMFFGPKYCGARINFPMLAAFFVRLIHLSFVIQIVFDEEENL